MQRFGLVGSGPWARNIVRSLADVPNCALRTIATRKLGNLGFDPPPGCRIHRDWRDAVADPELDGIIVATAPVAHGLIARAAIERDLPVFIEKPMTASLAEAYELEDLVTKRRAIAQVDHL